MFELKLQSTTVFRSKYWKDFFIKIEDEKIQGNFTANNNDSGKKKIYYNKQPTNPSPPKFRKAFFIFI